jgi:cytosine/adenosine deaminase-related metal-dependent hydrolase
MFVEPEDVRVATKIAVGELLLTGCTTASDFAYLFPSGKKELFDEEVETARELGIRFHPVRGCVPVLEGQLSQELERAGVKPELLVENKKEILKETERVIDRYHDESTFSMLQIGLGPSAMEYGDESFVRSLKELAASKRVLCHTHLHPRPDEVEICGRLHGKTPLEYLEAIGWLDRNTWIAHATRHTAADIEILARTGTGVSHSPSCHMRLGYPVAPIPQMLKRSIPVGIGVDGGASNDSGNMLAELRTTMLVHRIEGVHRDLSKREWFSPQHVFEMAITAGATILNREEAIGSLEEGKAADLISIPWRTIQYAGGSIDPLSALIFCGNNYRVAYSIVNGEIAVENGKLVNVDEEALFEEADATTRKLIEKTERETELRFR